MATPANLADALFVINQAYNALGYGDGNTPAEITAADLEKIGYMPESKLNPLFHEINRILSERWFSNSLNDSAKGLFRFLIRNEGAHGFGIVDRFVNLIESTPYPTTGADIAADLVTAASSPVDVKRYTNPYAPGRYKGTIMRKELRKFLTPDGLVQYISWIENNLFQSAELGIMAEIVGMIKAAVEAGQVVTKTESDMNTENGLVQLVEDMMTCVDAFRQPTAMFNVAERLINTPESADVVIVTTPSRWNRIRAHLLSDRYHLDQLYVDGRVIFAPEGSNLGTITVDEGLETEHDESVEFVICDARAWVIEITTMELLPFTVANMDYLNLFLHVEGVEGSIPTFTNAIAFTGVFGSFHDGGDSPEPEPKDIILTAISSAANNNVLLNGTPIGVGTAIDNATSVYAATLPVKRGDVVARRYSEHGSYIKIYTVAADGTRTSIGENEYTVTGDEYAILTFGSEG